MKVLCKNGVHTKYSVKTQVVQQRTSHFSINFTFQPNNFFCFSRTFSSSSLHGKKKEEKKITYFNTPKSSYKIFSKTHKIESSIQPTTAQVDCEQVTKMGVYANLGLFFGKLAAGLYSNSSAMVADAIHSFSDLASDFATFWAVRHSHKPSTEEHPYGYGKYEAIGTLTVGGLLFTTSVGIMWHSVESLMKSFEVHQTIIEANQLLSSSFFFSPMSFALYASIISIGVKEALFQITLKEGKKHHNQVIIANAWHHRSDAISSLVAFLGIGSSMYFGNNIMDSVAGIAVGAMITKLSIGVCKDAVYELTDRQIDGPIFSSVCECIGRIEGVKGFHQLRGRKMGPYIAMDVHIVVDGLITVTAAHQIAEKVRHQVMVEHDIIGDFLVHVDPLDDHATKVTSMKPSKSDAVTFKRSYFEVEKDVKELMEKSYPDIIEMTHFNCHYLNNSLSVQIEVRMSPDLTIDGAANVARKLQTQIMKEVKDVDFADIHLEILD